MSCGVVHRLSSDPALLWLWQRPTTVALIPPLAWKFPYAAYAALKKQKRMMFMGFLLWLSGLRIQLISMRMLVKSLASLIGLRIQNFCGCGIGQLAPIALFQPLSRDLSHAAGTAIKQRNKKEWSSCCGSAEMNLTSVHQDTGSILVLTHWVKYPTWLWLLRRPAAKSLIRPLAWESLYATGVALKRQERKKKNDVSYGFVIYGLYYVEVDYLYAHFLGVFIKNG